MQTKFQQAMKLLLFVIKRNVPGRIALLKSYKQRSQLELLQVSALLQRFQYCRELITKEGFEKYNKFCEQIYTIYCRTGEKVVKKGDQGKRFYLILQGTVMLVSYKAKSRKAQQMMDQEQDLVPDYNDESLFSPIIFKELNPGDHFGDMALLDNGRVSCTIICKTFCQFVCMDKIQFVKFIGKSIPLLEKLEILQEQQIFNSWTEGELRALSYEFKIKIFHQEEYIFKEDQKNEYIYLVMNGQVQLNVIRNKKTYKLCLVDQGQIFGDDLEFHTCNAKCTSGRVELYIINRQILNKLFDWHPESRLLLKQMIQQKCQWRLNRLNDLMNKQQDETKQQRNLSIQEIDFMDQMVFPKFLKLKKTPYVKRLTNIVDNLDLQQKKIKHKEILQKLNYSFGARKIEFFKGSLTLSEKKKKKEQQQASFYQQLGKIVNSVLQPDIETEKINRASSMMMTKTTYNSTQTKLSPIKRIRKVFSIEGTMINIKNKS